MFTGATAFNTIFVGYSGYPSAGTPLYTFFNTTTRYIQFSFTHASSFDVQLPLIGATADISWGDGTSDLNVNPATTTHTYSSGGSYDAIVNIATGAFTACGSDGWTGVDKLTGISTTDDTTWELGGGCNKFCIFM